MVVQDDTTSAQIERILNSETLRNAEVLRRLLRFLAQKSIAGEADNLKEYTVGLDALGKPASYDPRRDSVVRIQIGRLRNKLAEYYRTEGKDDPVIVQLPKGHFKLTWETRPITPVEDAVIVAAPAPVEPAHKPAVRVQTWILAGLALWAVLATFMWANQRRETAPFREAWTPELEELWRPFLSSNRPLIVAVASPLFIGLQGNGMYRDLDLNRWEDVLASTKVAAVRKALGEPAMLPRYYYTGIGEMSASFLLGKLLNFSGLKVSTARSSQISWQQMADNNVLFVGAPRVFGDQLHKLPVELDFYSSEKGIVDRKPGPGQPSSYEDDYPSIAGHEATSVPDDGILYALISHMPGPLGTGDVLTFNANHSPGTLAAVQWFTNPPLAKQLAARLRRKSGELPRYYQLILKVKYQDAVPTAISYVTHRELTPEKAPAHSK